MGGVGGAAATYLAAAGVGRLVLVHPGRLEVPDLNRQTLMHPGWLDRSRAECAATAPAGHYPDVDVVAVEEGIDEAILRPLAGHGPAWDPLGFSVLGAVAGTVGTLAAMKAVKVPTGWGHPLEGRLLVVDLADATFRTFRSRPDPGCPVCADTAPEHAGRVASLAGR